MIKCDDVALKTKILFLYTRPMLASLHTLNLPKLVRTLLFLSTRHFCAENFTAYNLQRQNSKGINAPIATKTGNIIEESSIEYGSGVLGPLVCRLRTVDSSSSSCIF